MTYCSSLIWCLYTFYINRNAKKTMVSTLNLFLTQKKNMFEPKDQHCTIYYVYLISFSSDYSNNFVDKTITVNNLRKSVFVKSVADQVSWSFQILFFIKLVKHLEIRIHYVSSQSFHPETFKNDRSRPKPITGNSTDSEEPEEVYMSCRCFDDIIVSISSQSLNFSQGFI